MNQGRYQEIQRSVIAFLEAHLVPMKESHYRQIVTDFIAMIDDQFPGRSSEDLATATRGFLATWQRTTWPTLGQLIRGLTAHMPALVAKQIAAQEKPNPERHASKLLRSSLGRQAIELGIASWLEDWAKRFPDQDPPAGLLDQLKSRDDAWQRKMSTVAAGAPSDWTAGERPIKTAQDWANLGLEVNKRREASLAEIYGQAA